MITEDYCSFELSKLLKEKGFDVPCLASYHIEYPENNPVWSPKPVNDDGWMFMNAPTHQMAMKWLREKWIIIEISFSVTTNGEPCYNFGILSRSAQWVYRHKQSFFTYEEAVEAAIKYSLENLI